MTKAKMSVDMSQLTEAEQRVVASLKRQNNAPIRTKVTKASRRATLVGIAVFSIYVVVMVAILVAIAVESHWLFYSAGRPLGSVVVHILILLAAVFAFPFWFPPFRGFKTEEQDNYRVVPRTSAPFLYAVGDRLNALTGRASGVEFRISLGAHAMVFREKKKTVVEVGASVLWLLTTKQLLAVLAHEFAHTSQEGGRTTLGWIRRFNGRLARAYLPWPFIDPHEPPPNWLQEVLIPIRNVFLQPLLQLHRTLDAALKAMSREMEYEADAVAVEITGTEGLKDGLRRITLLEICQNEFLSGFEVLRSSNYLPRDFSRPPAINAEIVDESLRERGGVQYREGKGSIYESHPSLKNRLDHADTVPLVGVLPEDVDDCVLLKGLAAQTTQLTAIAMGQLQEPPPPEAFVDMEEFTSRIDVIRLYRDAEVRFFGGLPLPSPASLFQAKYISKPVCESIDGVVADLGPLRAQMRAQADDIEAHLQSKSMDYVLPPKGLSGVVPAYEGLMETGARRLTLAFAALSLDTVQQRCEQAAELHQELSDHRETAGLLPKIEARIDAIDRHLRSFAFAYQFGDGHRANAALLGLEEALKGIEFVVDTSLYLYRGDRSTTLREHLLGPGNYRESMETILQAASRSLDAFRSLSSRIMGALCRIAEEVEAALGLEPIEGTLPAQRQLPRRIASPTVMVRKTAAERADAFKRKLQGEPAGPRDEVSRAKDASALQRNPNQQHRAAAFSAGHLVWIAALLLMMVGRFLLGGGHFVDNLTLPTSSVRPPHSTPYNAPRNSIQPSGIPSTYNPGYRGSPTYPSTPSFDPFGRPRTPGYQPYNPMGSRRNLPGRGRGYPGGRRNYP